MAKKKISETLLQQRKARENFLELKKMQSGEQKTPEKAQKKVPKTFKEKLEHIWYYYKIHIISILCAVLVITVSISQCSKRTDFDMRIVYFSYSPVLDEQIKPIGAYLERISEDLNGDGQVNIQMINCSMIPGNNNVKYNQAVLTQVQAIIASEEKAMLFMFDSKSADYFKAEALGDFFETDPLTLGNGFHRRTRVKGLEPLPSDLQVAVRRVKDTTLEKRPEAKAIHREALRLYEELKKIE